MQSQALEQVNDQALEEAGKKGKAKKRRKKPMSGTAGFFLGVCFVLLLLALYGVLVFLNAFNLKTITVDFIAQGVSPYTEIEAKVIEDQRNNLEKEAALNQKEGELDARAEEIAAQEILVANRLSMAAQALDDAQFYKAQLEDTSMEAQRMADIYARIDAGSAGTIIAQMGEIKYMIRILKRMDDKRVAAIFESIDPDLAALLTKHMIE